MLNTQKLLYILPDVAYVAELVPAKKEHSFAIQAFRQINGEFMTEDEDFNTENIEKLFGKLEAETYHLILPDFLFTNTIIEVKETQDSKIKAYLKDDLLPNLELAKTTHELETFILTEYNGVAKVQLTALEKSVLAPISQSAHAHKIHISAISPITWTIKSMISLEPSVSVIQIGTILYVAEHYIGVDQCTMAKVEDIENVGETIKTLKGSQPSIQTIYLLTNDLVEDRLKEFVSNTLPVQQLTSGETTDEQLPNFVRNIIEAGMKTLDIAEYPVPKFALPEATHAEKVAPIKPATPEVSAQTEQALPLPTPAAILTSSTELSKPIENEISSSTLSPKPQIDSLFLDELDDEEEQDVSDAKVSVTELPEKPASMPLSSRVASISLDEESDSEEEIDRPQLSNDLDHRIANVEPVMTSTPFSSADSEVKTEVMRPTSPSVTAPTPKPLLKNKQASSTARNFIIMLVVFIITVVAGSAVGFMVVKYSEQSATAKPSPTPVASAAPIEVVVPSPLPSPSPTASESASLRSKNILIVNATTKAGYAGVIKAKLDKAGFKSVKSGNAKGEYATGNFVLMTTEEPALTSLLSGESGLDLTFSNKASTEDAAKQYDAVIVLAE